MSELIYSVRCQVRTSVGYIDASPGIREIKTMLQGLVDEMRRMKKRIVGALGLKYEYFMHIQCGFLRRNRGPSTISMRQGSSRNPFLGHAPLRIVVMLCVLVTSLANAQSITSTSGVTFSPVATHTYSIPNDPIKSCQTNSYTDPNDTKNPRTVLYYVTCWHLNQWGVTVADPNCHPLTGSYCGSTYISRPNCPATLYRSNGATVDYGNIAIYANMGQNLFSSSNGMGVYNQISKGIYSLRLESGTPPPNAVFDIDS